MICSTGIDENEKDEKNWANHDIMVWSNQATFPANTDKKGEKDKAIIINPTTTMTPIMGTIITFATREIMGIL